MTKFSISKLAVPATTRRVKAGWTIEWTNESYDNWFHRHYKSMTRESVSDVEWHRVRVYTHEAIEWVLEQDSNYWYKEENYSGDFWLHEELYTLFLLRWSECLQN